MTPENFVQWIRGYFDFHRNTLLLYQQNIIAKLDTIEAGEELGFCYWLQGYYELTPAVDTTWDKIVKDHLQLVFKKVTPDRSVELNWPNGIKVNPIPSVASPDYPPFIPQRRTDTGYFPFDKTTIIC